MSRKNVLTQYQIITNASMSSTVTSAVTNIQFLDNIGLQLNWTGSPTGNFAAQVSADYAIDIVTNTILSSGNWAPILLNYWNGSSVTTAPSIPASVGSPIYLDLNQLSAPYIRVVFTSSSGSGTANGYITSKALD